MIPTGFHLAKLPFTLFFQPQDFGDKITLSSRLRDAADGVFDGESLILPVPPNGPPDVPRIQLESRDKSLVMQISLMRLTLEWNRRAPEPKDWTPCAQPFFSLVERILRVFAGEYVKPTRFALNPQFIRQLDQSANEYLASDVIEAGRVLDRPSSVKIGILDQFVLHNRPMNLWMNVTSARQQQNPQDDRGLVVHFDYNSAAEDQRPWGAEEIIRLIAEFEGIMEKRFRSFFGDLVSSDADESKPTGDAPAN